MPSTLSSRLAPALFAATAMLLALGAPEAVAQDAAAQEEAGGAPDEGATVDYTDLDTPPPPLADDEEDGGDWGGGSDDSFGDTADTPPPAPAAIAPPADQYAGDDYGEDAYAGEPEAAPPKNLPPVEGMDDFEVFGATFGAAAAMNVGVGGAFALASAGVALGSAAAPAASGPLQTVSALLCVPSCLWSCFAAPVATGYLVAYLGDMLGKKRGAVLFPALVSFGAALLLAGTVGLAGALVSSALVAPAIDFNNPLNVTPLTPGQIAISQGISITTAAVIGVGMSAAAATTYLIMAEDRRPGDEGGGTPGITEPGHTVPLRLSSTRRAAPTVAQRY